MAISDAINSVLAGSSAPNTAPTSSGVTQGSPTPPAQVKQNDSSIYTGRGRQTVFGLNYDGSLDLPINGKGGDNGQGFFVDPSTGKPYNTRNPNLIGASLNVGLFNGTVGNRYDKSIQAAVSRGDYKVKIIKDNGETATIPMVDSGPAGWTGNAVDLTKGAADMLHIHDNSILNYQVVDKDGNPLPIKNAPPVPTSAGPSGQTRGQQYGDYLKGYYAQRQQYAPGLRVASPDELDAFENYTKNGGDTSKFSDVDMLAFNLAKDPGFLFRDGNFPLYQHFVYEPQHRADPWQQITDGITQLPSIAVKAAGQFRDDMNNTAQQLAKNYKDGMSSLWNHMPGAIQDPGADARLAQDQATSIKGVSKAATDFAGMLDGAIAWGNNIPRAIQENFVTDPKQRMELDQQQAMEAWKHAQDQFRLNQAANNAQGTVENVMRNIGMTHAADMLSQAKPDDEVAQSMANTVQNIVPFAAGKAASSIGLVRTAFLDKIGQVGKAASEDLADAAAQRALGTSVSGRPILDPNVPANELQQATATIQAGAKQAGQTAAQSVADSAKANQSILSYLNQPGGIGSVLGKVVQNAGEEMQTAGDTWRSILDSPNWIAGKLTKNPVFQKPLAEAFRWLGSDAVEMGTSAMLNGGLDLNIPGLLAGRLAYGALQLSPEALQNVGGFLRVAGRELTYGHTQLPYWNRVAQQTTGLASNIAKGLDNPLVYNGFSLAKGGVSGAAIGAAMGAAGAGPGGQAIPAAFQGAASGGIFGLAGAGYGQWAKYNSPAEFLTLAKGDWKRYRDILPTPEKASFDKMSATDQLALSQAAQHFPNLKVEYFKGGDQAQGWHQINKEGDPVIGVNLDSPGSALKGIMAHELTHNMAMAGKLPDIYSALLGDPATGKVGQYTALGLDGKPVGVDPNTGRYIPNQDFQNLAGEYKSKLASTKNARGVNISTDHLSDLDIAQEIYAEHGADYMLSGNHIADAQSAFRPGWHNANEYKTAMAKLGVAFDRDGGIVQGTGLFNNLQRNSELDKLTKQYFQQRYKDRTVGGSDDIPDRKLTHEDLKKPGVAEYWLDGSPEVMRNADGSVMRDKDGGLFFRNSAEVKRYNAALQKDVSDYVNNLPEDKRNAIGFSKRGEGNFFVRYLPDELIDHLASKNQYNPNQLSNLRALSQGLADKDRMGQQWNTFYQKAYIKGNRYGSFAGASRDLTPYGFEVTNDGNINVKGVDFHQLNNNYLNLRDRNLSYKGDPIKLRDVWAGPNDFTQDAHQMFVDHSEGRSGAANIGEQKRDLIHGLAKLDTSVAKDANPFAESVPSKAKSIIKSFRLDRMNQLTPSDTIRPFKTEDQYNSYLNRNFLPAAKLQSQWGGPASAGDITKIPEMFSNSYLTAPQRQKLSGYFASGKVAELGNRIVDEYNNNWSKDPDAMAGHGWYTRMTPLLRKYFGGDTELFVKLLAATSPQTSPLPNWDDALAAYTRYKMGHYDGILKAYQENGGKIEEWMKPRKPNDAKLHANSDRALEVLTGEWNPAGPKTPNYNTNLLGTGHEATIDLWAHRMLSRLAGWQDKVAKPDIDNLEFALGQHAFRHAADKLGMNPDDLQAIAWYGEQKLYGEQAQSYDIPMKELMENGNKFEEPAKQRGPQIREEIQRYDAAKKAAEEAKKAKKNANAK